MMITPRILLLIAKSKYCLIIYRKPSQILISLIKIYNFYYSNKAKDSSCIFRSYAIDICEIHL